jgi:hypothetical protein
VNFSASNGARFDDLVLDWGAHRRPEDGMCVMEAVSYLAGEPFGDRPPRGSRVVGAFLRRWNDDLGDADRQVLKRYIPRLLDSTPGHENEQAWLTSDWLVRELAPAFLRLADLGDHADTLEGLPPLTGREQAEAALPSVRAAQAAADEASVLLRPGGREAGRAPVTLASHAAAWAIAWEAARSAGWSAAGRAMWALADNGGDPPWTTVGDAARIGAWDAARKTAWDAASPAAHGAPPEENGDAAWVAARDATRAVFRPAVEALRGRALALVDRLLLLEADARSG